MRTKILTLVTDIGLVIVLLHYGLGGWHNAVVLMTRFGVLPWLVLGGVLALLLYRSDYRRDVPLFAAGWLLGYWGEWWGTTRGVWAYWNGATPPVYLPPLWGVGLITVNRLAGLIPQATFPAPLQAFAKDVPRFGMVTLKLVIMTLVPLVAFANSWSRLLQVDWRSRLDIHFVAGLAVGVLLICWRFELHHAWRLFLAGTLLGGLYEYLGTNWGEWSYITGETPPWWIAPLWGYAALAMTHLADGLRMLIKRFIPVRRDQRSPGILEG